MSKSAETKFNSVAVCLQDKAPEIKSEATEDISQEDWISIKESLALASERDELEKIKEDREEFQEVRLFQRKSLLPFFFNRGLALLSGV